uniref:BPM/SPOP BACK domain-containing protein n=1 Tax=Setaria italica TaxID=4555 RepID=K3Y1P9_SETIT
FKAMLHFIYTDTCPELAPQHIGDIGREESMAMAQHLLSAADRFGLTRLKLMCQEKLCSGIDVAEQHSCSLLKTRCVKFIFDSPVNLEAVIATEATEGHKHLVASCPFPMSELLRAAVGRR